MFIDDILNNWDELVRDKSFSDNNKAITCLKSDFENAASFNVDNVKKYLDTKDKISIDDCPNVYPQYPVMWFEWNAVNDEGKIKEGILVTGGGFIENNTDYEYSSFGIGFVQFDTRNWIVGELQWNYNKLGICDRKRIIIPTQTETFTEYVSQIALIALFSISLMHCKNVSLETINYSEKLNKSRIRKGKKPLVKYHVLNINSMKRVLDGAGANSPTGLRNALHICRGHFKDFSKGGGLFGKYQGLYWWDPQVRGKIQNGVMLKDYKVSPDKKGGVKTPPGDMAKKDGKS